jgi:hypothetical protein
LCAALEFCKAPPGVDLSLSSHHCVGCQLKIHCALFCGLSLHEFVAQYPDCVGLVLSNGRKITSDDPNNEMLTICFTCISQYANVPDESLEDKDASADEDIEGSVSSFSCYGDENMTGTSILAPNYIPPLRLPGKSSNDFVPRFRRY